MIQLSPEHASPALRALFDLDMPAGVRCRAVFAGNMDGQIFTDDNLHPTWAVMQESTFGTLYPVGAVTKNILTTLVDVFRQKSDVLIGLWGDDPIINILPDAPQYQGFVFDFTDRAAVDLDQLLATLPEDCEIRPMDEDLWKQSPWYEERRQTFSTVEAWLEREIAFGLVQNERLVSEASAGKLLDTVVEMGTITHPEYRKKGYATFISAYVVRECEKRGLQTYWNTNKGNNPSVAIAKKLGYQTQREYQLYGWFPDVATQ